MTLDLDAMGLKELKDLQARVARAISSFEDRKKQDALRALEEKARDLGFSLGELMGVDVATRKRRPARAKYANPSDAQETWTGRGRKPRWVEAALKAGRKLEDLLIR